MEDGESVMIETKEEEDKQRNKKRRDVGDEGDEESINKWRDEKRGRV